MEVVVFDLGGVLLQNDTFPSLAALLGRSTPLPELRSRWLRSTAVRQFELGRTGPAQFATAFIFDWQLGITVDEFLDAFAGWVRGFHPGAQALLHRVGTQRRIACLSNSNVVHWERFDGFREYFDVAMSSHLLGAIKPDAACFEAALATLCVPAERVLFFDDSGENVAAARALGIRAIQVEGTDELETALAGLGLA